MRFLGGSFTLQNMNREILLTSDGSATIAIPELNVTYHSRYGALQESMHVFIKAGLDYLHQHTVQKDTLKVFEMGFGTGLNALLTIEFALQHQRKIYYEAIELNPLTMAEVKSLSYTELLYASPLENLFLQMHNAVWSEDVVIDPLFTLHKMKDTLVEKNIGNDFFDLIYYDAFAPAAQPELWTTAVFERMFNSLKRDGILVTYCSKGDVRRAMQAAGFTTEKLKGPPGKREMIRAKKQVPVTLATGT